MNNKLSIHGPLLVLASENKFCGLLYLLRQQFHHFSQKKEGKQQSVAHMEREIFPNVQKYAIFKQKVAEKKSTTFSCIQSVVFHVRLIRKESLSKACLVGEKPMNCRNKYEISNDFKQIKHK